MNTRIRNTGAVARASGLIPAARISVSNVKIITTTSGSGSGEPIGLLLALTYAGTSDTTTTTSGGYSPHARIE